MGVLSEGKSASCGATCDVSVKPRGGVIELTITPRREVIILDRFAVIGVSIFLLGESC